MAERFSFDTVHHLGATSIGEPGNRFFFLIIGGDDGWVRVWLQKEQMRALAEGFDDLLARLSRVPVERISEPATPARTPDSPMLGEFLVARLAVGYDSERDSIVLLAHAADDEQGEPALACRATREQVSVLARQAAAVCDAGRPLCQTCGLPIDPTGHLCPKSNGHRGTGL